MEYIKNDLQYKINEASVITLGKFDGLHMGHELLISKIKEVGLENNLKSIVFTFDIPPRTSVNNEESKLITTNREKEYIFEKVGIDILYECPFTKDIMCMTPEAFIEWIVSKFNIRYIVVGNDFKFGHNRAGDYNTLKEFETKYNYRLIVMDKKQYEGRDISSTYIREEIEKGNIQLANKLLGYPFFITGEVIHGKKIGRTIGIPTINMKIEDNKIVPPFGVYVSKMFIDKKWYLGVSNIGKKPTIEGDNPLGIETYILDFDNDIYGKEITVFLLDYIRPEKKFDSIEQLKKQINNDVNTCSKYYKNVTNDIDNPILG